MIAQLKKLNYVRVGKVVKSNFLSLPFTPFFLLLAIVYLMAILTPTSASAAGRDSVEVLAAWAKSKNWPKDPYSSRGYRSDKNLSFDIHIVYDRGSTLVPFNNRRKTNGRSAQTVTETGENITIASGIPAYRLYTSIVHEEGNTSFLHEDGGRDYEKWEYYCHDYRVLIRAHRDNYTGSTGSDPLALLEDYITFVNNYPNIDLGNEIEHKVKSTKNQPAGHIEAIIANNVGGKLIRTTRRGQTGEQLKKGDKVYWGDILLAGDGTMVKIILTDLDDQPAVVMMKAGTRIQFDKKTKNKKGGILLFVNKLFFKGDGRDHNGFKVITSNDIAGVEGTMFEITYEPNSGKTTVSVFEGVVSMKCKNSDEPPILINAGKHASMDKACGFEITNLTPANNTPKKSGWDIDVEPGIAVTPVPIIANKPDKDTIHLKPVADAHVYAYSYRNWNKANWGKHTTLETGWHPVGGEKRAYLKFDLSGIDQENVKKATLRLFQNHTSGKNTLAVGVHAVTGQWQEGSDTYHSGQTEKVALPGEISWVNQPSFSPYQSASFLPNAGKDQYIDVDITQLVRQWLAGTPNNGLVLKVAGNLSQSTGESVCGFASREHPDKNKHPRLILSSLSGKKTATKQDKPLGDITRITDHPDAAKNLRGSPCGVDRQFVFSLYQSIFERDPSNMEITRRMNDLRDGLSRKEMIIAFFKSQEYLNMKKGGHEANRDVYQAVLGREPTVAEKETFPRTWPYMMASRLFEIEEYRDLCSGNDQAGKKQQVDGYNPLHDSGMGIPTINQSNEKIDDLTQQYQQQQFPGSQKEPKQEQGAVYEQPSDYTSGQSGQPHKTDMGDPDANVAQPQTLTCSKSAAKAYREYMEAYNRLNYYMSRGRGDEPGAQTAYEFYKFYKDCYEAIVPPDTSNDKKANDSYHKQQQQ